jgi:hypothetical protein
MRRLSSYASAAVAACIGGLPSGVASCTSSSSPKNANRLQRNDDVPLFSPNAHKNVAFLQRAKEGRRPSIHDACLLPDGGGTNQTQCGLSGNLFDLSLELYI